MSRKESSCLASHRAFTTFFFFNDTATTEIYTLSLHDALPISDHPKNASQQQTRKEFATHHAPPVDRKSTRLNSSHLVISYAVFCLKKKTLQAHKTRVSCGNALVIQR